MKIFLFSIVNIFSMLTTNQSEPNETESTKLECTTYGLSNSTCCLLDEKLHCLPSFLIAGTQKSGTTVLSAILSDHPQVIFHRSKEAHYFDRTSTYTRGLEAYLLHFKPWTPYDQKLNTKISARSEEPPKYGESTPFYIASRNACLRMALDIPNVKLIILLREPVSRAYSEYQMKKRRVETQNEFIALMQNFAVTVYTCLLRHELDLTNLKDCVPPEVTAHSRWNRFMIMARNRGKKLSNLDNLQNIGRRKRNALADICYRSSPEGVRQKEMLTTKFRPQSLSESLPHSNASTVPRAKVTTKVYPPRGNENLVSFNTDLSSQHTRSLQHSIIHHRRPEVLNRVQNTSLIDSNPSRRMLQDRVTSIANTHSSRTTNTNYINPAPAVPALPLHLLNEDIREDSRATMSTLPANQESFSHRSHVKTYTNPNKPWLQKEPIDNGLLPLGPHFNRYRILNPNLIPRHRQLLTAHVDTDNKTISSTVALPMYFQPKACLGTYGREKLLPIEDAFLGEINSLQQCGGASLGTNLIQLDQTIDRCVKVRSGISAQYIYRSLYAAQLMHCFKFLPRDRFLILPSERLQQRPHEVITQVLRFLNLTQTSEQVDVNSLDYNSSYISRIVRTHFPKFETNTGWQLRSNYSPLNKDIAAQMQIFFEPFNAMLFDLLHIRPYPEWSLQP